MNNPEMQMVRIQYRDHQKSCFGTAEQDGTMVTFTQGDQGTPGDTRQETFPTVEAANQAIEEQKAELLKNFNWVAPFEQDPRVAEGFAGFLDEITRDQTGVPDKGELTQLQALHNVPFPPELAAFIQMRSTHELAYPIIGEWRVWTQEFWIPQQDDGNLMERLVLMDQQNYLGTEMMQVFGGLVWIGSAGNGDGYFAALDPRHPENCEVVRWDHEQYSLDPIADSLSSLAWANRLLQGIHSDDGPPVSNIKEQFGPLENRVSLSWQYGALTEGTGIEPDFEGTVVPHLPFLRARWIFYLLKADGVVDVEDIPRIFNQMPQHRFKLGPVFDSGKLATNLPTAFYWLWRLFFFNKDPDLRKAINISKAGDCPMVRDMALLVEELQDGRRVLGKIEDIHAVRTAFLALDLDPDRAEARAREEAEQAQAAATQKRLALRLGKRLCEQHSPSELMELAWKHVGNTDVLGPVFIHLREVAPELQADFRRLDFVLNGGTSDELEEVRASLAAGHPGMAPWLLTLDKPQLWPVAAQLDPRTAPVLLDRLGHRSKHNHPLSQTVIGLGHLRCVEAVAPLLGLLEEFFWDEDDFMGRIQNTDLMRAVLDALGRVGDPRAIAPVLGVVNTPHKDLTPRAITTLGRLGDKAPDAIVQHIEGLWEKPALFALGMLGEPRAEPAVANLCQRLGGAPEHLALPHLVLSAISGKDGVKTATMAMDVVQRLKHDQRELHQLALVVLERQGTPAQILELATPFLDAEQTRVRQLAVEVLNRAGFSGEITQLDPPTVDTIFAQQGAEGLATALSSGHPIHRHNVLKKAAGEGFGAAIETEAIAVVRELARFQFYAHGFVSDDYPRLQRSIDALARFETPKADAFLWELAGHPNVMIHHCDVFKRNRYGVMDRLRDLGDVVVQEAPFLADEAVAVMAQPLGETPWLHGKTVKGLAWTPDGQQLVSVSDGGSGVFDKAGAFTPFEGVLGGRRGFDVDTHPDNKRAALASHGGHLDLIDLDQGTIIRSFKGHGGVPNFVAKVRFSPSGAKLASVSNDHTIQVWDTETGQRLHVFEEAFDANTVAWLDEDNIVCGTDKHVVLGNVATGDVSHRLEVGAIADVAIHAGSGQIYAAGVDGILILDRRLTQLGALDQPEVSRLRFSADDQTLFATSFGDSPGIWRWDVASKEGQEMGEFPSSIWALALEPGSGNPFVGCDDARVFHWEQGELWVPDVLFHAGEVEAIHSSESRVWSVSGRTVISWDFVAHQVSSITLDSKGKALAQGDGVIAVGSKGAAAYELGSHQKRWEVALERCEGVVFVNGCFVFGSGNNLVWVEAATGDVVDTQPGCEGSWLEHLILIDEHTALVSGYREGAFHLWDLTERTRLATRALPARKGAESHAYGVADGRVFVSRWDRSVDVFDLKQAAFVKRGVLRLPHAPIAPNPSGTLLATGESQLTIFDPNTMMPMARGPLSAGISAMAWIDDTTLVCGLKTGAMVLCEIE